MNETVRLTHHDPSWQQEFEQTRSSIFLACEGWVTAVEHIGSTAIPGMIAQPVVDIVAVVRDVEGYSIATTCIEGLNFRKIQTPDWAEGALVLQKPRYGDATHKAFLVMESDPLWRQLVQVTSCIRDNAESQLRFETAKVHQWKARQGDAIGYERSKSIFFTHLIEQISRERES